MENVVGELDLLCVDAEWESDKVMLVKRCLSSWNVYSEILFHLELSSPYEDFGSKTENLWMEQDVTWTSGFACNCTT
jgi:hypothetical protein